MRLEAEFCSDPLPLTNTWQWGGTVLPAGSELDSKYKAELLTHPHMENCYISRLTVRGVGLRDSRPYTLLVENKHGRDTVPVLLNIRGKAVGWMQMVNLNPMMTPISKSPSAPWVRLWLRVTCVTPVHAPT